MDPDRDLTWVSVILMVLSAIVVLGLGWFILQAFLGGAHYIQSIP